MGQTVWGDPWLTTGSMQDASVFNPVVFNRNTVLRAARTWVIVIGDPTFTSLSMHIYSNTVVSTVDTPRKLLHTSTDVRTKSEIHTLAHGIKEIYFNFDDVPLLGVDTYNFVINAVGYVPTADSYLAWRRGFPDPVYTAGYTPAIETINRAPFEIYFIGGDL